jgi:DNA-binding transcriptional MerR regulator
VETTDTGLSAADQSAIDALPAQSALLVVQRGPNAGRAASFSTPNARPAGRRPDSDIFLDDVTVSRKHAEFVPRGDDFVVRDVGSLNGTYVQRDRIDEAVLRDGDEVQIGKFRMVFHPSRRTGSWAGDLPVVNTAAGRRGAEPSTLSIGAVLALPAPGLPGRHDLQDPVLEDQGLVEPERTPSGYRKFSHGDIERLRYVLSVQRDHYMPLRVIREHLDALDRGEEPPVTGAKPGAPRLVGDSGLDARLTRGQLCEAAGIDDTLLVELESHGLVLPRSGSRAYDADDVVVARTAGELASFGIEPRHLRAFRATAEREAGLVEQVVSPLRRQRGTEAAGRAEEVGREVAGLCVRLHAALVKAAVERNT